MPHFYLPCSGLCDIFVLNVRYQTEEKMSLKFFFVETEQVSRPLEGHRRRRWYNIKVTLKE